MFVIKLLTKKSPLCLVNKMSVMEVLILKPILVNLSILDQLLNGVNPTVEELLMKFTQHVTQILKTPIDIVIVVVKKKLNLNV